MLIPTSGSSNNFNSLTSRLQVVSRALIKSIRVYNHSRGVSRTSIHAFRHTFAKYWIRNNGDPFRLQKMLGHSSLDMTRNYVNMFSADLKDGFDSFSPLDKMVKKTGTKHKIKKKITTNEFIKLIVDKDEMINENGAIFPSLLIGWYSCLLKSNVAEKVVAVQALFFIKA